MPRARKPPSLYVKFGTGRIRCDVVLDQPIDDLHREHLDELFRDISDALARFSERRRECEAADKESKSDDE